MTELEIEVKVAEFKAEYAECGSHQILLKLSMDVKEAVNLYNELKELIEQEEQS